MNTLYLEGIKLDKFTLHLKQIIRECLEEADQSEYKKTIPLEDSNSKLLSRKEVSQYLKVSLVTLYEWEKKEILVPIRIGTRVRYHLSDIIDFTENQ